MSNQFPIFSFIHTIYIYILIFFLFLFFHINNKKKNKKKSFTLLFLLLILSVCRDNFVLNLSILYTVITFPLLVQYSSLPEPETVQFRIPRFHSFIHSLSNIQFKFSRTGPPPQLFSLHNSYITSQPLNFSSILCSVL